MNTLSVFANKQFYKKKIMRQKNFGNFFIFFKSGMKILLK